MGEDIDKRKCSSVKPRNSAPAFNIIPLNKHFHSYLYVGNNENLDVEHYFEQSSEMRYSGV